MKLEKKLRSLATRYRIDQGKKFRLRDFDPADTAGLPKEFKQESEQLLQRSKELLAELQDKLYAQDRWALLLIFQAMDAAGKDGTIKHVMSGVNPQGCDVSFLQSTLGRRAQPRLYVADIEADASARQNRNFQSLLLRGSAGGAGTSRDAGRAAFAGRLPQR